MSRNENVEPKRWVKRRASLSVAPAESPHRLNSTRPAHFAWLTVAPPSEITPSLVTSPLA